MRLSVCCILVGAASAASGAHASSGDAWSEFRKEVADACLSAGATLVDAARVTVDPFGSEHFGLALVEGRTKGGDAPVRVICVFDKATRKAEIGGELPDKAAE